MSRQENIDFPCLFIDAAGPGICVAVLDQYGNSHLETTDVTSSSELLASLISRASQKAGIKVSEVKSIVVTIGPGSFTGLRTALATANGIRLVTNARIFGVPTLIARYIDKLPKGEDQLFISAMDANKHEKFVQPFYFKSSTLVIKDDPICVDNDSYLNRLDTISKDMGFDSYDLKDVTRSALKPDSLLGILNGDINVDTNHIQRDQLPNLQYLKRVNAKTLNERGVKVRQI